MRSDSLRSPILAPDRSRSLAPNPATPWPFALPVNVPGGLLLVGDVHAVIGNGEACGTGVETRARLTLTIGLRKGRPKSMTWPRLETEDSIMVLAAGQPLDESLYLSVKNMVLWLEEEHGFERKDSYLLLSLAGHVRLGFWFTAYCILPRSYLMR